jgi:hypothetical protein
LTFLFEKSENAYSLKKYELSGAVTKEGGTFFVLPSTFEDPFLVVRSALSHSRLTPNSSIYVIRFKLSHFALKRFSFFTTVAGCGAVFWLKLIVDNSETTFESV